MNKVDWKSLEKVWGFIFGKGLIEKAFRERIITYPRRFTEEFVILVCAYEKFEELICK